MLSYFLLIMGSLLLVSCIVIYWRMSIDYKRSIRCYAVFLKDYKMQISFSTYKKNEEILQITKEKYSLLSRCALVFSIFSATLILMGFIGVKEYASIEIQKLFDALRIIQIISLALGALYIRSLNKIRNEYD